MEQIIGRHRELKELQWAMESQRSELIILYGRRRIGKTFLVRSFFKDHYTFHYVGAHKKPLATQLANFREALMRASGSNDLPTINNWHEAFTALASYLEGCPEERNDSPMRNEVRRNALYHQG